MQDNVPVPEDHKSDDGDVFAQTMTNMKRHEQLKFEFPFDLNNLFSMSYSFDVLQQAIEFLARQQGTMHDDIEKLKNAEPADVVVS